MERLQKIIAKGGVCSRRKAEELITSGHVKVNGILITKLGFKASASDAVTVDDKPVITKELKYLVINKPRYVVSSVSDDHARNTVISILPQNLQDLRLYPIGRLDYDTKGVLLLTNDGDFMNELVGPNSTLEKEYLARLDGIITKNELTRLQQGVKIEDYVTRRCKVYLSSVDHKNNSCLCGIILTEGKYHQVKKMFAEVGFPVKRMTRIRFGNITSEGLKEGEFRELTPHEIKCLWAMSQGKSF